MSGSTRPLLLFAPIALVAALPGCGDCGGCLYREPARPQVAAEDGGATADEADAGAHEEADAEPAPVASPPPGPPPLVVAQQFVVGWASGRLEPLAATTDGEAADMVRQALAGETVETPFGPTSADQPAASAFSFADRRAIVETDHHRISFTVTTRRAGSEPQATQHVVLVRRSDNKVVRWFAPSPLSDGGV